MNPDKKAKLILNKDCSVCVHYVKAKNKEDETLHKELCLVRKWSGQTGYAVAVFNKKYGVSAIPIYRERTCDRWLLQ